VSRAARFRAGFFILRAKNSRKAQKRQARRAFHGVERKGFSAPKAGKATEKMNFRCADTLKKASQSSRKSSPSKALRPNHRIYTYFEEKTATFFHIYIAARSVARGSGLA